MFIQTESTPNPETLKFIPGEPVSTTGPREFREGQDCSEAPLAVALFAIDGISRVFFGADFLTVTKAPILAAIMDHFSTAQPLYLNNPVVEAALKEDYDPETAQIVEEIRSLLDTRIRPAVAQDGGDIVFDRFDPEAGVVYLHMRGACAGCPSSSATLKSGVENMLRHYVPEVNRVEQTL